MSTGPALHTLGAEEIEALGDVEPAPSGAPEDRFLQRCIEWVYAWNDANASALASGAILPSQIVLFLYSQSPKVELPSFSALGTGAGPMFAATLGQGTQGVVVCNENFRQMIRIKDDVGDLDAVFALVESSMPDDAVFAIASLAQRRLFVHQSGEAVSAWLESPTEYDLTPSVKQLSANQIEADVKAFHSEYLELAKSPLSRFIWKGKSSPYQFQPDPERRIQSYLFMSLKCSYRHLMGSVDEETVGKGGRCDIRVQWPTPGPLPAYPYTTTMLELKVLAEASGPAFWRSWVESGINQAADYRLPNTEAVYAYVFDGRRNRDDQMSDLTAVAASKDVRLRIYSLEAPLEKVKKSLDSASKASRKKRLQKSASKKATKKKAPANS